MRSLRRMVIAVSLLALTGGGVTAAAPVAIGTASPAVKPVIGKPVTVPATPLAGARFSVSFKVTRAGMGTPLRSGRMICDPSVDGAVIRHVESFRGGVARLSFVVPESAADKALKVTLTIRVGAQSTTKVSLFRVRGAPPPSVSIGDVSAAEGNEGTTTFSFPVTLSAAATRAVSVDYATGDATAVAPSDYAAASGTVTFSPGEVTKTIPISVVGDIAYEQNETFTVALSNPLDATVAKSTATGTIVDDELVLVAPGPGAVIPQNVPNIGCAAHPTRGYGHSITFQWRTSHRDGIAGYRLLVQHRSATLPLVNVYVAGAESTSATIHSCQAFVADSNLTDWEWSVTVIDNQGNPVARAQGSFAFAPCRLADGTPCYAAP